MDRSGATSLSVAEETEYLLAYEDVLVKYKDERDRVQKKTFTKWINQYLLKVHRFVNNLYEDLQDGQNLLSLLEVLSGATLPREKGRMRFHRLQNVQTALDFLKRRQVKLVNIRNDDITDGNPKLTLGLIWTIILHFQISEIHVRGESEDMTAKEKLLLWSRQTSEGYAGVHCDDFTSSWRDGRLFNAIIHKYRPDLVDMARVCVQPSRRNLEHAFSAAERLGVARLLDPEDVDVTSPDEKSVITYVSTLYDVFPKVVEGTEGIGANDVDVKWEEYQNMVKIFYQWMEHNTVVLSDRNFPSCPEKLKELYSQYLQFKEDEIPPKESEKSRIEHLYRMLQVWIEFGRIRLPEGFHPNEVEKEWAKLIVAMLEREKTLRPEIDRLAMLQQIANRVQRDCVAGEDRLGLARAALLSESKRLESGIQFQSETEIAGYLLDCENLLRQQVVDIQLLLDGKFYLADQLVQRVSKLRDNLLALKAECSRIYSKAHEAGGMMISSISQSLSLGPEAHRASLALTRGGGLGSTDPVVQQSYFSGRNQSDVQLKHMQIRKPMLKLVDSNLSQDEVSLKFVQDLLNWVEEMQMELDQAEWGSDLPSVASNLGNHKDVHKAIEEFHMSIKEAKLSEIQMSAALKQSYVEKLSALEKQYKMLLECSAERLKQLHSLYECVSRSTQELIWLNEKEEEEVAFDWSEQNTNVSKKRDYHANLMRELDEKEDVIKSVQEKAEALLMEKHPARLTIEAYRAALQTQWSWILQLCHCVEQHLKDNTLYFEFFNSAKESLDYLKSLQDAIHRKYECDRSSSIHRLEVLIQESMEEKEQLLKYSTTVGALVGRAKSVVQLKVRNHENPVRTSIPVKAICDYRQIEITIGKDDECVLVNNSHRAKWKVISPSGNEAMVPSVCFSAPPPNKEATEAAGRIEQLFQNVLSLWHRSHINMKSIVSWHYLMMDIRTIRKSTVASIKTLLPGDHETVLRSLQTHFEDFTKDSEESEVFTMADCVQLEKEVLSCKEYYEELLKSAEREEHEESIYNLFISEVRNLRVVLEGHEEQLIRNIRVSLDRDDLQECVLRLTEQEKRKVELERLKEELERLKDKCEVFFREAASSPSVPVLSSELASLTQYMNKVFSMCAIYLEKLKSLSLVVEHSHSTEDLVKLYEAKLCEDSSISADITSINSAIATLKQWRSEIDGRCAVFHDLEDELQKTRAISERLLKAHDERDLDLFWHGEKTDQLKERWQNIHSQIENRIRDLEGIGKAIKYYRDTYLALDEWSKDMEARQMKALEDQPEDSKTLSEYINQQKVLVSEIEQKQGKIEECQTYLEQYTAGAKDYELLLMTYRAIVDSQHKSPVKRRKMQSSSDALQQEFTELSTRFTALDTLMSQYMRFASETLKRSEEDEVSVDDEMLEKEEGFEEMSEPLQQNLTKPGMTEMENRGTKDQLKSLLQNDIPSLTNQGMQVHTILANKRVAISSVHWSVNTGLKQNMIMDIEDVLKNKPVCLSVLNQLPNISNVADFSKNTQFRVKLELQTLSENGPVIVVEVESMGRISFPVLKKMLKSIALQRITLNSSEVQSSELEWHDDLESKNTQKGFWSQVDGKGSLDVFRSFYEAFKVFEEAKPLLVSSPKISEYRLKFLEAPAAFSPYVMTVDVQADHLQISAGTLLPPHDPAPVFVDFHKFFSSVSKEKCTDVLMVLDKHNRPKLSILTKSQLFPISSDASLSSEAFQFHMIRSEDMEKTVQINKNVKKTFSGTLLIDENSEDQRECSSGSAVESLEIHEYLCLQQTAPEKQTDFLETLQELLDDLSESENRLNGHQQQVVPANSEENQQRQVVDEALLKDLRWNNNALNATISSAKKFLEERHCELNPEQTSSLETKLKELTIKTNTFNQKAEGSGRFLENEPANEKKDAVELQNTKRMLLDVISNAHEEKDKAGTQKEPLDRKKGKTLDQPRIPETGDPNGNPVETTEASEDSECDAVDQQHYRPKACHQELFSPQQDLMITPPALGFLGKKALITNLNGSITPAELQAQTVQKELCLFQGDCREFEVWLEQNQRIVEDLRKPSGDLLTLRNKLQNQRVFSEDVASREEDLHFVTISGQMVLDAARTPDGSPMLDLPATRAEVKDKLENIAGNYSSLQEECKQLGSDLEDVVHQYTAFQESRSSLVKWLNETEAESRRKRSEVNTGDPEASHRQLDETKSFLRKMEDHQASVETLRKAAEALVRNCGEMLSNQEEIRETVVDIFSRFDELLSSAEEHSKTLQMISTEISLKEKETVSWMEESVKNKPSEDQARNVPQDQAQEHKFVENSVRTSDKLLDVEMLEALSPKLNEASERLSQNISSLEKLKYKVAEFDLTAEKVLEFVQKNSQTNQPRIDVTEISRLIWDTNEVVAANLQNVETLWELCEEIHVLASEVSVENNVLEKIELTLSCRVQSKEFKEAVEVFLHWLDSLEKQSRSPESFSEEILGSELEKVHDLVKEWSSKAPTVQEINDKGSFLCRMISSTSLTTTKWPHTPEEQNTSFINKSYRLVGELLNVRSSELSLLLNTPAEVHEQADSLNQWPQETNQAKTQWENCLSGKDGVELQAEPQKALKESGTHKQEKLHELTENPDSPSWRQMSPQTDGVLGTEKMEESTHMLDFLHSTLPQLSQWLHEKEMMFSVLGPLSTDSNMLDMQKQQVEILQKEFESRGVQYEKLNQVCSALAVEGMLEFVSQKWQALTEQLSDRLCLIDQVLERCSHFKELVTSLGERKNILEKELEQKLVLPNVSEENAQQIEDVSVILDQLRHEEVRLKEAELLFLELSAIVTEENLRSDLRNQLESIRKQFSHLEDKAGKHIECLHSARTTSQQFYQTLHHFQAWIKQTVEEQGELLPICADVDLLKDKISENASIQNSITENERLFNTVMSEGEALLQSTAGSSKVPVQTQLSALRSSWLDVRRNNEEQEKKLGEALQKAMGYQQCVRKIDLRLYDYKNKLENVRFCMSLVENERYLTEVNAMQTDLERQSEWVEMKEATESLLNVLPVDNDVVREEMVNMSEALEKLTRELKLKKQSLENIDQNLKEFNNLQKETEVLLDGARKKLQSDSAMDLQANTSLNLTSLKALQSSLKALHNPIERIQELAQDLAKAFPDADGIANLHLQADNLRKDHIILCERAEDVCSTLEDKLQDIIQLQNSVGEMFARFTDLDDELDGMVPVGRDLDTVCDQQRTMKVFRDVLQEVISKTAIERERCSRLLEVEELPDLLGLKRDVETLCKKCAKLMGRAIIRDNHVEETLVHLQEFYSKMHEFTEALKAAENQETFTGSFELKTESIKQQLESIKTEFESLSSKFQDVHSLSLGLIQNASAGTTRRLEDDFELVKTKWNVLNNKLAERSSHLHEALLHCGTFQDALDSFLSWMTDTEELMANQKPPSAEFRVVKAQIEEQKLLQRVLEDRRATVELIMMEGRKLTVLADAVDQENVAREMRCLCERWDVLVRNAEKRKQQLESILLVAKQFHETLEPLTAWLTVTEKSLANSEPLGTQILKLQEQISQHETLKECVMERGETLLQALSLGEALQSLCCVEDQEFVRTSLENTRRSFAELRRRCGLRSELLKQAGRFHADATELASWLEDVDNRLRSFSVQDCECSVLAEQHVELVALHGQIEMRKPDVEKTTRNGLELMKQTTGDDAAVLQRRLDELKTQYSEISRTSLKASNTLQKALSLATKLADGRTELEVWMETVQVRLKEAEEQTVDGEQLRHLQRRQNALMEEVKNQKPLVESLKQVSSALMDLVPWKAREGLDKLVSGDLERYRWASEAVTQRAQQTDAAIWKFQQFEKAASSELAWLTEAEKKLSSLCEVSLDLQQASAQLQAQKAFSLEVMRHKDTVDDIVKTGEAFMNNRDEVKLCLLVEKSAAVGELNSERCLHLDKSHSLVGRFWETHDDLWQWLLESGASFARLSQPALEFEMLQEQQENLRQMRERIAEHKPHVGKMNKIALGLVELSPTEAPVIREKVQAVEQLYSQLRADVNRQASALEEAISKYSQFHTKIGPMLETLELIVERLHRPLSISGEVEKIQEQICDNRAVTVNLDRLQPSYETLKQRGEEIIACSEGPDPAAKVVQDKLDQMLVQWRDIQALLEEREARLLDVLDVADKYWCDLCSVSSAIVALQDRVKALEEPGVDPSVVKQQQESLEDFREELTGLQEELNVVRNLGAELLTACGDPDKVVIKKSMEEVKAAWEGLNKTWTERVEMLEDAMQAAVQFEDSLQNMFDALEILDVKLNSLSSVASELETVKQQIEELKEFKKEAYHLLMEMERLRSQAGILLKKEVTESDRLFILDPLREIQSFWDSLDQKMTSRQHKLERALLALGQHQLALDELLAWLSHTEDLLGDQRKPCCHPKAIEIELAKHHVLQNDVLAHRSTVEAISKAGNELKTCVDREELSGLQHKLENLQHRWERILQKTEDRRQLLRDALQEAQGFHGEIEAMQNWLKDTERRLPSSVGGLPDTVLQQLNTHLVLCCALEAKEESFKKVLQRGQQVLAMSNESPDGTTALSLRNLQESWQFVQVKVSERRVKLEEAQAVTTDFQNSLLTFITWLTEAELTLTTASPVSLLLETATFQRDEHRAFETEMNLQRKHLVELDKTGSQLQYFSEKQDAVMIKNLLLDVQERWEQLVQQSTLRGNLLEDARKSAKLFYDTWSKLLQCLDEAEKELDSELEITNDPEKVKMQLVRHKEFQKVLGSRISMYDSTRRAGRNLRDETKLVEDKQKLEDMLSELRDRWDTVCGKSVERQNKLEEALLFSGQFTEALQVLLDWLFMVETRLAEDQFVHGDIDLVLNLIDSHKVFQKELSKRTGNLRALKLRAREMIESSHVDSSWVTVQIEELNTHWETVCSLSLSKQTRLEDALFQADEFHSSVRALLEWLAQAEQNLRFTGSLPDDDEQMLRLIHQHQEIMDQLEEKRLDLTKATSMGETILSTGHPDAISSMKNWIAVINARFQEVSVWARQHQQKLSQALEEHQASRVLLEDLMLWLQWAETTLTEKDGEPPPQDLQQVKRLIDEHQTFMEEMTRKQPDVDKITKTLKRRSADHTCHSQIPVLCREQARNRFPVRSMSNVSENKNPKVKLLVSRWQQVWLQALERRRKLNEVLENLEEIKEFSNFDFDVWRKRYMHWMNHKKSRVMDFFRRMDKDQDGRVTRKEFIEGILSSKFPTSRLEVSAVADIFDRNSDGYIDYYEFVAALHPNKDAYKPLTEDDKIEDEVTRQVAKCKCPKRFQVEQIGANKYRFYLGNQFGDSQQLRLVRILRSTVMVRVGGGWMALDEFLVKNDPCRVHHHGSKMLCSESNSSIAPSAIGWQLSQFLSLLHPSAKGRTNVELREKLILPEGTTQVMASFCYRGRRSRPTSRGTSPNRSRSSQAGPPQVNPPSSSFTKTSHLSRNYDKPWLTNSKTAASFKSSESFDKNEASHEKSDIHSSKLRLPGYLSGKAFHAVEDRPSIRRTHTIGSRKILSQSGSGCSSQRDSDASDFDISDIQSLSSDVTESVSGQRRSRRSRIPTPKNKTTPISKVPRSSLL